MEVIVVMTIIVILGSMGLFYGLDNLWGHSFRSDRNTLISALQHSRAEAVANICRGDCEDGKPHGVYIDTTKQEYILFQGNKYSPTDNYNLGLEVKYNISYSGVDEIVFNQLSGEVIYAAEDETEIKDGPWNITLTDNVTGKNSVISINSEGQILWTN